MIYIIIAKMSKKTDSHIIHFERKLIKVGDSYAITVPKKWVEAHGHKLGDVFSGMANSILTVGRKQETNEEEHGQEAEK